MLQIDTRHVRRCSNILILEMYITFNKFSCRTLLNVIKKSSNWGGTYFSKSPVDLFNGE